MILLKNFLNIFRVPELRKRVFFTLGILIIYRLGSHIPVIGIDIEKLRHLMSLEGGFLKGIFSYMDMFSGGGLAQGVLFALGMSPYITASIVVQLLGRGLPWLEALTKEGEYGRKVINQYTRYLALVIAIVQGIFFALSIEKNGLALNAGWDFRFMVVLSLTVGSIFVMWLGEQISIYGVGNGGSMIIFAGIVARYPSDIVRLIGAAMEQIVAWPIVFLILFIVVAIAAIIVWIEKGERKIAVQYARRVVGPRMYGGQSSYIPFKINPAGVMPVILANTAMNFPLMILSLLSRWFDVLKVFVESMTRGGLLYNLIDFLLIIAFVFVYTSVIFNPEELAENIKKGSGFVPGIRPGRKTVEFFQYILIRIGLVGAVYLGVLAVAPNLIQYLLDLRVGISLMSGTGLLIMVGVALETAAQVESYLIEHRYDGFLSSGRLRSGRAR